MPYWSLWEESLRYKVLNVSWISKLDFNNTEEINRLTQNALDIQNKIGLPSYYIPDFTWHTMNAVALKSWSGSETPEYFRPDKGRKNKSSTCDAFNHRHLTLSILLVMKKKNIPYYICRGYVFIYVADIVSFYYKKYYNNVSRVCKQLQYLT